jgi:hypothetical protein
MLWSSLVPLQISILRVGIRSSTPPQVKKSQLIPNTRLE